jgi:hypothetical protein
MTATKLCRECGETQPLSNFHNSVRNKDGKQSYCKACASASKDVGHRFDGVAPRDPNVVPPITITNASQRTAYTPEADRTYYRNGGNKHIKSRGTGT